MFHKSIYNFIYKKSSNHWFFYNTLYGSIVILNDEYKKKYDELDKNICNDNEFVNSLITQKFLISNDYDEKKIVDASRYRRAYGEKSAYIRILTTTSCNARCSYCYEKGFKTEFMNMNTAEAIVKFILKMPKMEKIYIHWFGGEPLLNIKVIDFIMKSVYSKLKKRGTDVFVYFTSNGSLLNEKLCEKARVEWHANYFQITIDDIGEKYNKIKNYINKSYNYERVINNIDYLLQNEIKVILRINYKPFEVEKVKKIIEVLSNRFIHYCKDNLLIFDPAPIFETQIKLNCSNCQNKYNMFEPAKFLYEKNLLSASNAFDLNVKGGQCYACHQGSFVISPNGDLYKCTVAMKDEKSKVGSVYTGIDRNKTYFDWVNPKLTKKCDKCVFLPICQGGCKAGELGFLNVKCKRNLSEIKNILNYKVDEYLKKNLKLIPLKECINNNLYEMYQDIPKNEVGSENKLKGANYETFLDICNKRLKEEKCINENIGSTTNRYILFCNDYPIGEVGIRTTINDYWENKGSQIFYKIRKSERNKGYGNIILHFALIEAEKLGFKKIRINCDNKNIYSKKIILKNGGVIDIKNYSTKDGTSSSYVIDLNEK